MRKIILHIGAGKTGSSAIQASLARNADYLSDIGVLYPYHKSFDLALKGKITSGNGEFLRRYLCPKTSLQAVSLNDIINDVLSSFSRDYNTLLYSNEALHNAESERLSLLVESLNAESISVEIIYYVRDIADHAYSRFGQNVKRSGYAGSFELFCKSYVPPFEKRLRVFESHIPKNKIHVINYDNEKKNLIGSFYRLLGADGFKDDLADVKINRSLTPRELDILLRVNSFGIPKDFSSGISDMFIYNAPDIAYKKIVIHENELQLLHDASGSCISYLRDVFSVDVNIYSDNVTVGTRFAESYTRDEEALLSVISAMAGMYNSRMEAQSSDIYVLKSKILFLQGYYKKGRTMLQRAYECNGGAANVDRMNTVFKPGEDGPSVFKYPKMLFRRLLAYIVFR